MIAALCCQLVLLLYHQLTTLVDFFPFNGAKNYSRPEKFAEAGSNLILMGLAPVGFGFRLPALIVFGVIYYWILFAVELLIWWVPYFTVPAGAWRRLYNFLLACGTSNFSPGDTLDHWVVIHRRLHQGTITFLPAREGRPVPNLEHTLLHAWTLFTAIVTVSAYLHR